MFEQCIEADAFPLHVEMSPLGDAGNVHHIILHGELQELLPGPGNLFFDETINRESPFVEERVWSGTRGKDGKIIGEILARRDAVFFLPSTPFADEPARDKSFLCHGYSLYR
jgi:hypothetical protein